MRTRPRDNKMNLQGVSSEPALKLSYLLIFVVFFSQVIPGVSDHLSPKAMPRCHKELFSSFYLLPSSVFLALQQRSDPPTPSTRPAAQLSGGPVMGTQRASGHLQEQALEDEGESPQALLPTGGRGGPGDGNTAGVRAPPGTDPGGRRRVSSGPAAHRRERREIMRAQSEACPVRVESVSSSEQSRVGTELPGPDREETYLPRATFSLACSAGGACGEQTGAFYGPKTEEELYEIL
ncbi:hypothetical protein E5288_WYG020104 [Bos mutus]|uniref:Uncharacterized protein n=1 Tax=Bos mutus TaxID=72004 RepID=A0A6B0SA55_9CETA|nr:hypothetical protein [Bos mutus]